MTARLVRWALLLTTVALGLNSGCIPMKPHVSPAPPADDATTVYKLDNGMRVVIREDHFAPVVEDTGDAVGGKAESKRLEFFGKETRISVPWPDCGVVI